MLDEHYDPNHCDGCTEECGLCMDAFKTEGGLKPAEAGVFCTRLDYDPDGYCVMRYAQRKCLTELMELAK